MSDDDLDMSFRRHEVERVAWDLFQFLVTTKGFVYDSTERQREITAYYFTRGPIGIGVSLEWRDLSILFYLVRLQDGKAPPYGGYGFTPTGERMRASIPAFLRDVLHVHDPRLDELFALYHSPLPWSYRIAINILEAGHDVVEHHIDTLLQQPLHILFPPRTNPAPPIPPTTP